MKHIKKQYTLTFLFLFLFFLCVNIGYTKQLKVGICKAPPYVIIQNTGDISGMSVEVWRGIAIEAKIDYNFIVFDNLQEILTALAADELDAALGPLMTTSERAQKFYLTQPYYMSVLGVMAMPQQPSLFDRIRPFLTKAFLTAIASLIFMLLIAGYNIWLFERKKNPQNFPTNLFSGIASGMWLALSVLTSVGFGDIVPITRGGRVVCGIWMIISMITATTMTAGLATILTTTFAAQYLPKHTIYEVEQLNEKTVAVVQNPNAEEIIRHYGGFAINEKNLTSAVEALLAGDVDAVVFDRFSMIYYLLNKPQKKLVVTPAVINTNNLVFAFNYNKIETAKKFNVALLKLQGDGVIDSIIELWIESIRKKIYAENDNPLQTKQDELLFSTDQY